MSEAVLESIDRLLEVEIRPQGLPLEIMPRLYAVARAGGPPLTEAIARALLDESIGRVLFITGVYFPPHLLHGEMDGPIGAVALGTVLRRLGKSVSILVDDELGGMVAAVLQAAGEEKGIELLTGSQVKDVQAPARWDAAITIERIGVNAQGVRHTIMGTPFDFGFGGADEIVEQMNAAGKLTVGIGDGGNEIGFGAILDAAREIVPYGADCGCPCHGGIVTRTATRFVLPASVSNFGAYAIAAGLAVLTGQPDLAVDPGTVDLLIRTANRNGCIDGGTADPQFLGDDGIPLPAVLALVTLMRSIVEQHSIEFGRHF